MIDISRLFARGAPVLSEADVNDAAAIAGLHAVSFHRGWSEQEFERLLVDRAVLAHRAMVGTELTGFILSRLVAGEAEILSVAVERRWREQGLARRLLEAHLRRLAELGTHTIFLEVNEGNAPARALYRRAGFEEAGRREGYYPVPGSPDVAALVLRCELP
jgi:[ribosomal protein S18]-alanine N-acetyltransferase